MAESQTAAVPVEDQNQTVAWPPITVMDGICFVIGVSVLVWASDRWGWSGFLGAVAGEAVVSYLLYVAGWFAMNLWRSARG